MMSGDLAADGYAFGYGPKENVLAWLKRNPVGDEAEDCMEAAADEIERLRKWLALIAETADPRAESGEGERHLKRLAERALEGKPCDG